MAIWINRASDHVKWIFFGQKSIVKTRLIFSENSCTTAKFNDTDFKTYLLDQLRSQDETLSLDTFADDFGPITHTDIFPGMIVDCGISLDFWLHGTNWVPQVTILSCSLSGQMSFDTR